MHKYLQAVGFKSVDTKEKLDKLLAYCEESFQSEKTVSVQADLELSEKRKYFTKDMGLILCGTYDEKDQYQREFYLPFFESGNAKKYDSMTIERHISQNSYAGACEHEGIGITLIYYLQNVVEYLSELQYQKFSKDLVSLSFTGLAQEGKILLPVLQDQKSYLEKEESGRARARMIKEARDGDQQAIESLTMEEMDTYSMISRRIENEDIMSIVATYFMPCGLECDQYQVMGEILNCSLRENSLTKEQIYVMTLDCNGLIFDICIHSEDLMGEPEIGRRFKGSIWLQGRLLFQEDEY